MITQVISTSGHLIPKFPEVRFHRTRIFTYQSKRTFIIGEVKALVPQLLFMSIEILPVITNLILKTSKKRSQIHPGRCYERSKKNRDRKHLRTRKSVL